MKAAKQAYFGCAASALTTGQVALIAGLPESPGRFNPVLHPERAAQRRQSVVKLLAGAGVISEAEAQRAAAENVEASVVPKASPCP